MSVAGFLRSVIDKFKGPWLRTDTTDVPIGVATLALNCEYNVDQLQKRRGFRQLSQFGGKKGSLFNWIKGPDGASTAGSYLITLDLDAAEVVCVKNLSTFASVNLFTSTAKGLTCAESGVRLYIAGFDYSHFPTGSAQVQIMYIEGVTPKAAKAFMQPVSTSHMVVAGVLSGGGRCTVGTHRFAAVLISNTGYEGTLSPVSLGVLVPAEAIFTQGQQAAITITADWPVDAAFVELVATTSDDHNSYFLVPGQIAGVVGGTNSAAVFTFNLSDEDLFVSTNITLNKTLLSQDVNGVGPFNPHFIGIYGERMGYITDLDATTGKISTAYFSEPEKHQAITADQHGVTLPGFKKLCVFFVIRKICYLVGPEWTYAVEDTGDVPALWGLPALVDGQIGTECSQGITVNASGGFAWVVSKRGLEIFSAGAYGAVPGSYYVDTDWQRINFLVPYCIKIVDDQIKSRVIITVPLDGATTPSHLMMFNYSRGLTPEALAAGYSLWDLNGGQIETIGLVVNPTKKKYEPWISASVGAAVGNLGRQSDPVDVDPSNDFGQPVLFSWESGILPPPTQEPTRAYKAQAISVRATGIDSSILTCLVRSLDGVKQGNARDMILSSAPGVEYFRRLRTGIISQGFTVRLEETTFSGYVAISMLTFYYSRVYSRK